MITPEDVNQANNESYQYAQWERAEKNRILSISNNDRKQKEWSRLFPTFKSDDSWMLEANVY